MPDPFSQLAPGTLVDTDMLSLASRGLLITQNFEPNNVRQACYELRASDIFYETSSRRENQRIVAGEGGYILRPHSYVTAIVQERIELPANLLARILTKGVLFSIGILPVNTYADPGFKGRLGITLCNVSNSPIVLRPGQAIAKIEFSVLPKVVAKPYSGQHGYDTEIWPVPTHLYATDEDLQRSRIHEGSLTEIELSYGPVVASLARRLSTYERKIWLQIALTMVGFAGIFALYGQLSLVVAVLTGVVANVLTTVGINALAQRRSLRSLRPPNRRA